MKTLIHERLKGVRAKVDLNQADFAKSLGIGQSTLAMLEVGKRDILDRHVKTICSIYNVNENWFRTGEGEMFIQVDTFSLNDYAQKNNLTELEIDIMRSYMDLAPDERKQVMEMMKIMFPKIRDENSATVEVNSVEAELESYRLELEAEQKGAILSASQEEKGKSS